jgi:hypothetical protein
MQKNNKHNQTLYFIISLLIIFILGLAPLLWFKDNQLIKSEDLSIPLSLDEWQSYLYSWFGQRATGTYPIDNFAALFFLFMPAFLQFIGLSIINAQKIQFVFWFMLSGFSIYYLLASFERDKHPNPLIVLPAVVFYMFNLYLEPVWLGFNIANLSAYVGLPFLAGFVINAFKSKRYLKYLSLAGLLGIILSGVGVNPPIMYVALCFMFLWLIYCFVIQVIKTKKVSAVRFISFVLLLILILTLINAFWIYPQTKRLLQSAELKPLSSYKESVEEGIKERSKYTSLLNVLRFQAAWTWHEDYEDDPYVLYSEFYKHNKFFIALSLLPVILVFLSVFNFKQQVYLPFYVALSLLGIICAVGIHAPFSGINTFFIKYIPGFWMIRSPWYKWSLFTVLGFSVCIYYLVSKTFSLWDKKKVLLGFMSVIVSVLFLVYAFPIASGRMFTSKEERHYIPPNHIEIPSYVVEAADFFDSQSDYYRIMVLNSGARRITDWGYAGYEPVLAYFTQKPIITPMMQASFGSPYSIPNFGNALYSWLYINKAGKDEKHKQVNIRNQNSAFVAEKILPMFNIKYLLYEGDLRWDFYDRYESPEFVANKLKLQRGIKLNKTFGKWQVYSINKTLPHSFLATKVNLIYGPVETFEALSRTPLFEYTNILKANTSESLLGELNKENLISKVIYYNQSNLPDAYKAQECLLLDTAEDGLFYKKEVADEINIKNIRIEFLADSYLKKDARKGYHCFKDSKVPLTVEINLRKKSPLRVNLKLTSLSQDEDRFIDIYLNEKLIKKFYSKRNTDSIIRLEALTLEPGKNILKFIPNDSEINGRLGLSNKVDIYTNEYNCDLSLADDFRGQISLYPKPIEEIKDLPKSIILKLNGKDIKLAYSQKNAEYVSGVNKFTKGDKRISFLQYQDEGYYVLITPEHMPKSEILPLEERQVSPVLFELKAKSYLAKWKFIFFLESADPFWTACLKEAHHQEAKYETHFIANGYANAWLISGQQKVGQPLTIVLKYSVQRQFSAGLGVSAGAFIICILALLSGTLKTKG